MGEFRASFKQFVMKKGRIRDLTVQLLVILSLFATGMAINAANGVLKDGKNVSHVTSLTQKKNKILVIPKPVPFKPRDSGHHQKYVDGQKNKSHKKAVVETKKSQAKDQKAAE